LRSTESSKFSRNQKARDVYCFYTLRRPASGRIAYKCVGSCQSLTSRQCFRGWLQKPSTWDQSTSYQNL